MTSKVLFFFIAIVTWGCAHDQQKTIAIQPFEDFDHHLLKTIESTVTDTYGVKSYILESIPLPPEAFINIKSPRYRADKLIRTLQNRKPDSIGYVLGLTSFDISFTKKDENGNTKQPESKYADWGIFGLGYTPGVSCIVSTYRLGAQNQAKFAARLKKIVLHELGHNFGLIHCDRESCVMRDAAESIKTIDKVSSQLCDQCKKKLQ